MTYSKPFNRNAFVELSLDLNHLNNFSTDQFDIGSLRGEGSYNWGSEKHRFKHSLAFNQVHLDQVGVNPYASEIAELVRAGCMTREQGLARLAEPFPAEQIASVKKQLGIA